MKQIEEVIPDGVASRLTATLQRLERRSSLLTVEFQLVGPFGPFRKSRRGFCGHRMDKDGLRGRWNKSIALVDLPRIAGPLNSQTAGTPHTEIDLTPCSKNGFTGWSAGHSFQQQHWH
jgi:hypothetical protein